MAFPQLYIRGIRALNIRAPKFWLYMLDGLYQSAVVYFITFAPGRWVLAVSWNGKGIDPYPILEQQFPWRRFLLRIPM